MCKKSQLYILCIVACMLLNSCYLPPNEQHYISEKESTPISYGSEFFPEGGLDTNYVPSTENRHIIGEFFPSDDHKGLYQNRMDSNTLSYYDFESGLKVSLCPQQGCKHQDTTCLAYQGNVLAFGIYEAKWYSLIAEGEHIIRFQEINPTTGKRIVIWEIQDSAYTFSVGTLTFSYGTAWFNLAMTSIKPTGEDSFWGNTYSSEHMLVAIDLSSKETSMYQDNETHGQYQFLGGCEKGYALSHTIVTEEPLCYEEYIQENPDATDLDYISYSLSTRYLNTSCRLIYHNNTTGENIQLCENVRMGDLNNCYANQLFYRTIDQETGNSVIYQLDLSTGENVVFWEDMWILNYTALDNKLICVLSEVPLDRGGLYYISLDKKEKVLMDNNGKADAMYFGLYTETQDRFVGYDGTSGRMGWIFKSDFWAGNYDEIEYLP